MHVEKNAGRVWFWVWSVCVWNEEEILTPTSLTNSIAEVDYIVGRDEKKSKFILIKNHT
jgi:hypothetical protein